MADVNDVRRFLNLKVNQLKKFLRDRGCPVGSESHRELAEKAFWADKLGLAAKPTDEEAEHEIQQARCKKLVFDGGIIKLPRPETLTFGWEDGPASLPETTRDHLESYINAGNRRIGLMKTEGRRTLGAGKGLYMSGHVHNLQYHGISANLTYCFVRGRVVPQQKISENPYHTWVILQKDTGQITTAECSCCVGVQGTCKHVTALLYAVVEAVEDGKNMSTTSLKQAWGKTPKKGKLHEPQFVKDINVVGVREDVTQQESDCKRVYRSTFDPRVVVHRKKRPLSDFNMDNLATITNGNCGLLTHHQREQTVQSESSIISNCKTEETVTTSTQTLTVTQAFEEAQSIEPQVIFDKLKLNEHQQQVVAEETKQQATSSLWLAHRRGRVTASVANDCAGSVKEGTISGHSNIARVMGYYGCPQSAALSWGRSQENVARKHYLAYHKLEYKHSVQCKDTGLWISTEHPFLAGSPDGIIVCKYCGSGLLEIKNPYTHRHLTKQELAKQKGSCLEVENGVIQLKRNHAYFAQVQIQMYVTGMKWCDFVVRTVSKTDNLFVERINYDADFIRGILPKLELFFTKGILPELQHQRVRDIVIGNAVKSTMNEMLDKLSNLEPTPTSDFPCGVCSEVCKNKPQDVAEFSICCDSCDRWFHYACAGISGTEQFLKKRKLKWKCSGCSVRRTRRKTSRK